MKYKSRSVPTTPLSHKVQQPDSEELDSEDMFHDSEVPSFQISPTHSPPKMGLYVPQSEPKQLISRYSISDRNPKLNNQ